MIESGDPSTPIYKMPISMSRQAQLALFFVTCQVWMFPEFLYRPWMNMVKNSSKKHRFVKPPILRDNLDIPSLKLT